LENMWNVISKRQKTIKIPIRKEDAFLAAC